MVAVSSSFGQGTSFGTGSSQGTSQSTYQIPAYSEEAILQAISQAAASYAPQLYNWAQQQYAQAGNLVDELHGQAESYASPARIAADMGMAEAGAAQGMDAARMNAMQDLQAYGIDPSAGRFAGLDRAAQLQKGAAMAGAGNQQRLATEATARALRSEAANVDLARMNIGNAMMNTPNAYLGTAMRLPYPPLGQVSSSQNTAQNQSGSQYTNQSGSVNTGGGGGGGSSGGGGGGSSGGGGGGGSPYGTQYSPSTGNSQFGTSSPPGVQTVGPPGIDPTQPTGFGPDTGYTGPGAPLPANPFGSGDFGLDPSYATNYGSQYTYTPGDPNSVTTSGFGGYGTSSDWSGQSFGLGDQYSGGYSDYGFARGGAVPRFQGGGFIPPDVTQWSNYFANAEQNMPVYQPNMDTVGNFDPYKYYTASMRQPQTFGPGGSGQMPVAQSSGGSTPAPSPATSGGTTSPKPKTSGGGSMLQSWNSDGGGTQGPNVYGAMPGGGGGNPNSLVPSSLQGQFGNAIPATGAIPSGAAYKAYLNANNVQALNNPFLPTDPRLKMYNTPTDPWMAMFNPARPMAGQPGSMFASGGGVPPDATTGGFVSRSMSPSGGQQTDDVPAMVNAGEFVIPRDVAHWKGHEFFQKMIAQSRKQMSGAPAKPTMQNGQQHAAGGGGLHVRDFSLGGPHGATDWGGPAWADRDAPFHMPRIASTPPISNTSSPSVNNNAFPTSTFGTGTQPDMSGAGASTSGGDGIIPVPPASTPAPVPGRNLSAMPTMFQGVSVDTPRNSSFFQRGFV